MRALVTGATGFVGRRLVERLDRPVILSRDAQRAKEQLAGLDVEAFDWDVNAGPPPMEAFQDVDVVFHLAGESVAEGRWTSAKKERIRNSRVAGTRNLVDGMAAADPRPRTLVSASAIGYYGNRGDEELTESSEIGEDFLAGICSVWEAESHKAAELDIRVVNPRIGIVLGKGGGALPKMALPVKLGAGSPLGSGRQWMSWIHLDDLVNLFLFVAENDRVRGAVNATAPNPVTNRDFTKRLGKTLHRPVFLPAVPGFVLRLGVGQFADVLLGSQRVLPAAATAAGFKFQFEELDPALADIYTNK